LKSKSGKEFDRAYDQMQLQAHEEAVALFEQYSQSGDNPDLKSWAAKTLLHLKEHLTRSKTVPRPLLKGSTSLPEPGLDDRV
jgi:putative membrane protein